MHKDNVTSVLATRGTVRDSALRHQTLEKCKGMVWVDSQKEQSWSLCDKEWTWCYVPFEDV